MTGTPAETIYWSRYSEGYDEGHRDGYQAGYDDGYADAMSSLAADVVHEGTADAEREPPSW